MSQHPQIKCREAVVSSIKLLLERFEKAQCDSDAVSDCARCNAVFLAKNVREMLDGTSVPEAPLNEAERLSKKWLAAHPHAMMVVEHAGAMLRDALHPTAPSAPSPLARREPQSCDTWCGDDACGPPNNVCQRSKA